MAAYESTSSGRRALVNVEIDVPEDADGYYSVSGASPVAGTGNLKVIAQKGDYNFARVHQTLRVTPAMEAGISGRVPHATTNSPGTSYCSPRR